VSDSKPFVFGDTIEAKRYAPATQRNREGIAEVLERILPSQGTVLEIASGTGEHLIHFAQTFPHLIW
jgi:tRNA G46 methylase TrmB